MTQDDKLPEFDINQLPLKDEDEEALELLSSLTDDDVRAPVITPEAQRYPPVRPDEYDEDIRLRNRADKPKRNARAMRYNIVSVVMLLLTGGAIAWVALVWTNPQTALNPLAPPTPFDVVTATPVGYDAELDAIVIVATETQSPYDYGLGEPVSYQANTNDRGCAWRSIAGQVVDRAGNGVTGVRVVITDNDDFRETVFSGSSGRFGEGGYELPVTDAPLSAQFTVQLQTIQGDPLSEAITLPTYTACDANVATIVFQQIR